MKRLIAIALTAGATLGLYGVLGGPASALNTVSSVALMLTALGFIAYFHWEKEWIKTPMGQSLMVMAVGVLILSSHGVAFQLFGPNYWGREWIVPLGRIVVIGAFMQRIWALFKARHEDHPESDRDHPAP